ncbi:MAG: chromate transporter [Alphaproteobacteria bacterium]|nr:chromate transporter [Alphaproteobacteria bacterium]
MSIYLLIFLEFSKIGLLAVGGGLVTIPFLLDISERLGWFSAEQLTEMIAISQSIPGPIGNNIAMFAGFETAGFFGGLSAIIGLTVPAYLIISFVSKYIEKYYNHEIVQDCLFGMRAASVALIFTAGVEIAKLTITNTTLAIMFISSFIFIHFVKTNIFVYIIGSATLGILFKM